MTAGSSSVAHPGPTSAPPRIWRGLGGRTTRADGVGPPCRTRCFTGGVDELRLVMLAAARTLTASSRAYRPVHLLDYIPWNLVGTMVGSWRSIWSGSFVIWSAWRPSCGIGWRPGFSTRTAFLWPG